MAQSVAHKHESTRRATYQDVLDAPAHRVAEIIDGTLYTHPRPAAPHARASSSLGVKIGGPFDYDAGGPGGWWIIDEPELHLGEEIVVPDLAGWRRERMPDYPDTAYFTLAPDWVCEVLSESTRKVDLHEKRPIYAREGVSYLWLVDPIDRTLEALELRDGQWLLIASAKDDEPVSIPRSMRSPSAWAISGPEGVRTVARLTGVVRPRESQSRALWDASHPRLRAKPGRSVEFPRARGPVRHYPHTGSFPDRPRSRRGPDHQRNGREWRRGDPTPSQYFQGSGSFWRTPKWKPHRDSHSAPTLDNCRPIRCMTLISAIHGLYLHALIDQRPPRPCAEGDGLRS